MQILFKKLTWSLSIGVIFFLYLFTLFQVFISEWGVESALINSSVFAGASALVAFFFVRESSKSFLHITGAMLALSPALTVILVLLGITLGSVFYPENAGIGFYFAPNLLFSLPLLVIGSILFLVTKPPKEMKGNLVDQISVNQ